MVYDNFVLKNNHNYNFKLGGIIMADENVNEEPIEEPSEENPLPVEKQAELKAYENFLLMYQTIARYNTTYDFEQSNMYVIVTQRILRDYNEQALAFLEDESEDKSLLFYLAGSDGLDQYDMLKSFWDLYNVYLY